MKQTWLNATYDLIEEIKAQDNYKRLVALNEQIATSEEIQRLVAAFRTTSERYEESKKYGTYHPDLKRDQLAFSEAKQNLYTHPVVMEYKRLEKDLQRQLDEISTTIATSISPKIKHPNELGMMPKH